MLEHEVCRISVFLNPRLASFLFDHASVLEASWNFQHLGTYSFVELDLDPGPDVHPKVTAKPLRTSGPAMLVPTEARNPG